MSNESAVKRSLSPLDTEFCCPCTSHRQQSMSGSMSWIRDRVVQCLVLEEAGGQDSRSMAPEERRLGQRMPVRI